MSLALKKHKRATISLGTIVEVTLWLDDGRDPVPAFLAAYQAIQYVHQKMSLHDDLSDLGKYRLASDGALVAICADTLNVLNFSETLFQQSQGFFDVCIGRALMKENYLPAELSTNKQTYLRRTEILTIQQVDDSGNGFVKKMPNTIIDLGGVAKGYAVDLAVAALRALNVPAALVNAGGDMRIYGEISSPVHVRKQNGLSYLKDINNCALATSGMPSNLTTPLNVLPIVHPFTSECLPFSETLHSIEAESAMIADALTKLAWLKVLSSEMLTNYNAKVVQ